MTQEQLVDICRLMDINKDGLVDLNEFLESFRLAEKSLHEEENELAELQATWQELDRCPSKTAVDKDETGVEIELLKVEEGNNGGDGRSNNERPHFSGECVARYSKDMDEIELIDSDEVPRRPGLLESDM